MTRVVVTGLGPVSSIGTGRAAFTAALRAGHSSIRRIRSFDPTGFPHDHGGEVPDFTPASVLRRIAVEDWGKVSLFAATAARLAATDAGLDLDRAGAPAARVSVVMGTTSGESQVTDMLAAGLVADGPAHWSPRLVRQQPASRLARAVGTELGAAGEAVTIVTACAASNYAIGYAYDLLRAGDADVVVAGGADAVCRWAQAGFYRLGALAAQACAPFDRDRSGILIGEGGAALVLETLEHARVRGARIDAEVLGYGLSCDAHHMVAPHAPSIALCMRRAHRNAGITPSDVDYVCAHGTGTPVNDATEVCALREVFGAKIPPVSSVKSMLGHTMGAASAFGAIASVLAITDGFLPPTMNWASPDPELAGIDPVPNRAREATVRVAQNNGFAFGGNNAITVLGAVA